MREPNPDRLLRRMPWTVFLEWRAYRQLEPFGDERADWRIAALASLIANIKRDTRRRPQPFSPRDFLLRFIDPTVRTQTAKQQWDAWLLIVGDHAAAIAEAKKRRKPKATKKP